MKKLIFLSLFIMLTTFVFGIWEWQRQSAILSPGLLLNRTEIMLSEDFTAHTVLLYGNTSEYFSMSYVDDYNHTWQSVLSVGEGGEYTIGYRVETAERNHIQPVFANTQELSFSALTLASVDAPDDSNFPNPNLEIIADYVSFNDEQLIFGIQNANGLYPTNESFTFFAYLAALINPQGSEDDIVYALMHTVNQPGIIEPGLYKIFGTGMDNLEKIADIDVEIDEGTLILACDWQPLLNDSDFMSWFDPENPVFAFMSITQKITLTGGVQDADEGKSCLIYPSKNEITVTDNTLPEISNLNEIITDDAFYLQLDYQDSEENFPVIAEIEFDNGQIRSFYPQFPDYSEIVHYKTPDISDIVYLDDWSQAVIRFSDNYEDFVQLTYPQTSSNEMQLSSLQFSIYPNPAFVNTHDNITIAFQRKLADTVAISIYNLKGQRVRSLPSSQLNTHSVKWDLRNESNQKVASGTYFIRMQDSSREAIRKVIIFSQ